MDSLSMRSAAAVKAQFEALLFEPLLKPMEAAFGEYGDIATAEFSRALANEMERSP